MIKNEAPTIFVHSINEVYYLNLTALYTFTKTLFLTILFTSDSIFNKLKMKVDDVR